MKIHTADGQTHSIDLGDGEGARVWLRQFARADFQRSITGISLLARHAAHGKCRGCGSRVVLPFGVQYAVARPEDCRAVNFRVEGVDAGGGGERLILFADELRLTVMAHAGRASARVAISKPGLQRFDPFSRGPDEPTG